MRPTASASLPQVTRSRPHKGSCSQRPAVGGALRALNLVAGLVAAGAAFVCVGFYAAVLGCVGTETHGLCVHDAWLVPALEWPIFVVSVLAPLAGAVAAYATRRPRWLGLGVTLSGLMLALMIAVSEGQTSLVG